ncbi:MAG: hypothetical protein V3T77_03065, partial [Planctomycetota bacterium]
MSRPRPPDLPREYTLGFTLLWGGAILLLYGLLRRGELHPLFQALAQHTLDAALPLLLLALHLPWASGAARALGGPARSQAVHLLGSLGLALGGVMGVAIATLAVGVVSPFLLLGIPLAASLVAHREVPRLLESLREASCGVVAGCRTFAGALWLAISMAALAMTLTPAISQDALHYHLAVPRLWLEAGEFTEIPGITYSRFPMNGEMLYLSALALRGEIAAKFFHWFMFLACGFSVRCLATRFVRPSAANWAAVIFLSTPTVFRVASWAYVEMTLLLFLLLAWEVFLSQRADGVDRSLFMGLLLGLGCGTKYTVLLPAAVLVATAIHLAPPRHRVWTGVKSMAGALLGGSFWYFRNWVEMGNPFYPFLYSIFGGKDWDSARAAEALSALQEWGGSGWQIPFTLTFYSSFSSVA